jgi:hypothetical protein
VPSFRSAAPLVLSLALLPACSSTKPPQPVTPAQPADTAAHAAKDVAKDPASPATPAASAASAAAAPASPAPPAANGATPEGKGGQVVVVDPGDDSSSHPKTLVEAARAERERRAHAGEPVAVITNKTLPHSKGQLTYAQPKAKAAGEKGSGKDGKGKAAGETHDEAYWRHRGLDIRQRLHDASEEIGKLEQQVADWRRRFYSEDDPARRDSQVKPEWDRALDKLQHKKEEVETTKRELDAYLEEGRRDGALPGWLREGTELEPAPPAPKPAPTDAIEPPVLDEKPPQAPLTNGALPS